MLKHIVRAGELLDKLFDNESFESSTQKKKFIGQATSLLRKMPNNYSALIDSILSGEVKCASSAPNHRFADGRVTLYNSSYFLIELNIWQHLFTDIHEHQFVGAFKVISGSAMEARYNFSLHSHIGPNLATGALAISHVHFLEEGNIQEIEFSKNHIHNVIHVDNPTATLIIRTKNTNKKIAPQFNYISGLRYNPIFFTDGCHHAKEVARIAIGISAKDYLGVCEDVAVSLSQEEFSFFLFEQFNQTATHTHVKSLFSLSSRLYGNDYTDKVLKPHFHMIETNSTIAAARSLSSINQNRALLNFYAIFGCAHLARCVNTSFLDGAPKDPIDIERWAIRQINDELSLFDDNDLSNIAKIVDDYEKGTTKNLFTGLIKAIS